MDADIFTASGAAVGAALRALLGSRALVPAVFCVPLDEAFAEARIGEARASETRLAPYGTMPPGGRRWIGTSPARGANKRGCCTGGLHTRLTAFKVLDQTDIRV